MLEEMEPNSVTVLELAGVSVETLDTLAGVEQGIGSLREARLAIATAREINMALVDTMATGLLAYNAPITMTTGEVYPVIARVIQNLGANVEQDIIAGLEAAGGVPQVEEIKVSPIMRAELRAESEGAFTITALSEDEQLVGESTHTEWQWRVVPETWGRQKLLLTMTAILEVPGASERLYSLPIFEREIEVQINPVHVVGTFVGDYWQWLATAIVLPLASWVWVRIRTKRGDASSKRGGKADKQLDDFCAALEKAFLSEEELAQMVALELSENLHLVAGGKDLGDKIFNLAVWARSEGRFDELVLGAYRRNRGNPMLKAFVAQHFGELPELAGKEP